jgi:hypothetical protein
VKSGVVPDFYGVPVMNASQQNYPHGANHAFGFGRDARNDRPEACATIS